MRRTLYGLVFVGVAGPAFPQAPSTEWFLHEVVQVCAFADLNPTSVRTAVADLGRLQGWTTDEPELALFKESDPDSLGGWHIKRADESAILYLRESKGTRFCEIALKPPATLPLKKVIETRFSARKLRENWEGNQHVSFYEITKTDFRRGLRLFLHPQVVTVTTWVETSR